MNRLTSLSLAALIAATLAAPAIAQDDKNPAIKARTAVMQLYGFSLGTLGAMAKGQVDYDADAATKAANNLVALTQLDQSAMWPQGSDSDSDANSRALPAIWANFPDVGAKGKALADAAVTMQSSAGQGLEALQGAMGGLGGACSACHKAYRKPKS